MRKLENTEVPELQDEERPASTPPPTAQTAGPNWLIFFLEAPLDEAIFEIRPRS